MRKLGLNQQALDRISTYLRRNAQTDPYMNVDNRPGSVSVGTGTNMESGIPETAFASAMPGDLDLLINQCKALLNFYQPYEVSIGPISSEVFYMLQDLITNLEDAKRRLIDDVKNKRETQPTSATGGY